MVSRIARGILITLALAALVAPSTALAGGARKPGPPKGIWTCDYIASHPIEAAAALVSCDGLVPAAAPGMNPAASVDAGVAPAGPDYTDAPPCKYVPLGGGYVSKGVFAWSDLHYFNYFSYSPAVIESFTYYIQKTNGVNVQWGDDSVTNSHYVSVGFNYYYWGAQNHGDAVQRWYFCWSSQ
jgi:hypothetical protein